jgi:TRAP-type C4-dicarboxylate transport system permease small subunit
MIRVLDLLLALALVLVLAVTVTDVAGRYLFSRPLRGADDLNGLGMALVVFLALPAVTSRRAHIRVDVLQPLFPTAVRRLLDAAFALVGAGVLGVVAWRLWATASDMGAFGDATPMIGIPLAPVGYALAALALAGAAVQARLALSPETVAEEAR